ncbi:hypothetical protein FXO38_24071 [Capsicum annuum]|nr:hypothetical protein FXO38_24071 [Capsicum annuum]
MVIVRSIIAVVAAKNWSIFQMDVHNAFLHGDLVKDAYMLGFVQSHYDYSLYIKKEGKELVVVLVYVDDILITGSSIELIDQRRSDLKLQFKMKYLGHLKFFLGIEFARSKEGRSVTRYFVKFGDALVTWKSKKQEPIARSLAEEEFRSMALVVAKITWLIGLYKELGVLIQQPVSLLCDSKAAVQIAANPIFHERTKYFDIDCHFVREKLLQGMIKTIHVPTKEQLEDLLTKSLGKTKHAYLLCVNLHYYSLTEDNTDELVSPVTSVKDDSMAEDSINELVSPVTSRKNDSSGSKLDKINTIKLRSMNNGNKVLPCYHNSSSTSSYNAGNTRRQSTGTLNSPDSEQDVLPHYLRASTNSCHEFCKYGWKHSSEAKPWHPLSKRKKKLPGDEQSPARTLVGDAKKGTLVKQKPSNPPGSVLGEKKKVIEVEQKIVHLLTEVAKQSLKKKQIP